MGTSPHIPEIEGLPKVPYYTSKTMMNLEKLPEHLLILGGGYIGLEFGQMYARLVSKVTVFQQGDQLDGIFAHPTYAEAFNTLFASLKDPVI